jgi:ribosome biogenesis GTPase
MNVGVVARVDLRQAILLDPEGREVACRVRARFMDRAKRLRGALVAGDEVEWEDEAGGPVVEEVLPRRNRFSRRAAGESREHVIAANLDEVMVVASLRAPAIRLGLLDRVAIAAAQAGIPLRVVLTKTDLTPAEEVESARSACRALRVETHAVSIPQHAGIEDLFQHLRGRRTLAIGHSGVGKSSLLNAFAPDLGMRIGAVNPVTGKGRHTTTAALLVRLPDGTEIVDTPGFRSFTPYGASIEAVHEAFPDVESHAAGCRFPDCVHGPEPACAVRAAAEAGDLDPERVAAYRRLLEEIREESAP